MSAPPGETVEWRRAEMNAGALVIEPHRRLAKAWAFQVLSAWFAAGGG